MKTSKKDLGLTLLIALTILFTVTIAVALLELLQTSFALGLVFTSVVTLLFTAIYLFTFLTFVLELYHQTRNNPDMPLSKILKIEI